MTPRPLVLAASLLAPALACSREPSGSTPAAGTGATAASPRPAGRPSAAVQPARGPCATDADCTAWLEPCRCSCVGVVGEPPPVSNEQWGTMCGGGPPGNCGVASPCMNHKAICDQDTRTCQAVKWR